jgi:Ca2+-binding RTX toxin-like protein
VLGLAVALAVLGWPAVGVARAASATARFDSPGQYSFTVPVGVTSATAVVIGAAGGSCPPAVYDQGVGGAGAAVTATVAVSPGEELSVGVGSPGGNCGNPAGPAGAGGTGGGGAGGAGQTAGGGSDAPRGGAGGGGASFLGLPTVFPGLAGLLVVAGAGGGASFSSCCNRTNGGASGSPGEAIFGSGVGGGAGTLTSGGAGGASGPNTGPASHGGSSGSFGLGGAGGDCDPAALMELDGGGGGGGGYYGGGGGGCGDRAGSGGGGGSSFVAPGAANVSMALSSAPPGVSITYAAPTADASETAMRFGTQAPGTAGPAQTLTVANKGSAPLVVSAVLLGGDDPDDFLVGDRCQQPVAVGSSCQVGVRFHPQATGARSATLTVMTNAPSPPAAVALSGGPSAAATCAGRAATSGGGAGADALAGTRGADVLAAGAGDDRIAAGGGNDLVCAGPGDDRVVGGAGNDRVAGGPGDDRVAAGPGDDRVAGGPGNDRIVGGGGQDRLDGHGGNDALRGGAGRDTLIGGAGSDTLSGGAARDELDAGPGDDRVDARDGAPDRVLCGDGTDVVQADPSDHLTGCEDIRR